MAILSMSNLPLWVKVLCLLAFTQHSTCSPVSLIGDNSLVDGEDTSSMFVVNKSATNLGAPVPNCATLPSYAEWFQPSAKFDNGDCLRALQLFYDDYARDHDGTKYEFLASGVTPVHGIPTQRVPLKVAFGTCYVVIAMRNMFVAGELPGETPSPSAGSDISSFTQLYHDAMYINAECSRPEVNQPGWYPAGDLNSIAVFIWQAGSKLNERIRTTPHTGPDLISASGHRLVGGAVGDTA